MADDTDELAATPPRQPPSAPPLSWPLVERRRSTQTPPLGIDRRRPAPQPASPPPPTLNAAPLWPFRAAALAGALLWAVPDIGRHTARLIVVTVACAAVTTWLIARPVPYKSDPLTRLRIVGEQAFNTAAVLLTGHWASPFVLLFIPTGMLAGFAAGGLFSLVVSFAPAALVSVGFLTGTTTGGTQAVALWFGLLGLVAFTSGLTHAAAFDAARQQQVALDRVSRLAEANSLLFALQRVAQTLPASLDDDEVLDSTVGRLRTMLRHDTLAVYLADPASKKVVPARSHGLADPSVYSFDRLPLGLRTAIESPRTVRLDALAGGEGVDPDARSGLYASLRARGALVGVVAVESRRAGAFGPQEAEIVHGLAEPFGIAIDNARMFKRIRTLGADEERSRIARELHDHVGSSLAMVGFEIDRARGVVRAGGDVEPVLAEVRAQVTAVVADLRETLHDLRTDITDNRGLAETVAELLERVGQRSGLLTNSSIRMPDRLARPVERELWQITREAILNAERHARAQHLMVSARRQGDRVSIVVRDDGTGFDPDIARPDSYGLVGMRERAGRLDAELTLRTLDGGGTEVRIELDVEGNTR